MKTLKIGHDHAYVRSSLVVALAFTRGWELYADEVNNAGGVKIGNDTYTIELIQEDSKGSAEGASTAATKLVSAGQGGCDHWRPSRDGNGAYQRGDRTGGVLYAQANANIPARRRMSRRQTAPGSSVLNHAYDTRPIGLD